jgi:hypothetical protein
MEIDLSKDDTTYKSSQDKKFSSNDSIFSSKLPMPVFLPIKETDISPKNDFEQFSKENIIMTFNNQQSSKKLQKNLLGASKELIDFIIEQLSGIFRIIIKNKNGNYFCSDLFKICNKEQRIKILKELSDYISDDCTDEFGTHPIQKLIEFSFSEEEYKLLLMSFNDINRILMASLNHNGSFVIQKLIVHIPETLRMDFNLIFVKLICILSRDMYGVCSVKKFIAYTKNELIVKQILNIIMTNFISISDNQYGNYLIQYLMEKWWKTEEGKNLKKLIISKYHILYKNQYSYYICDLFLKLCNDEEKKLVLSSLYNYPTTIYYTNNQINSCLNKFGLEHYERNELKYSKNYKNEKNNYSKK